MKLDLLPKIVAASAKRVGRGIGSGRGKTSGRGMKGANARGKMPLGFTGDTLPLYKKLPYQRGVKNSKVSQKMVPVSVDKLSVFKKGDTVNLQSLVEAKIITSQDAKKEGAKLVGASDSLAALEVSLPVTKTARMSIEKAGGKLI